MNSLKVLMADDEEDILEIMARKVKEEGYEVVTASDGEEAWLKIQEVEPDIVVLDLTMPKLDGLEILDKVKNILKSSKWIPVIIVSARNELKDLQKGYSLEADHYITKPCSYKDIIKAIKLMESLRPQRIE